MGSDIFIAHSREDLPFVDHFALALESADLTVWRDIDVAEGAIWRDVILEQIEEVRLVIVLWSGPSVHSEWVPRDNQGETQRQSG